MSERLFDADDDDITAVESPRAIMRATLRRRSGEYTFDLDNALTTARISYAALNDSSRRLREIAHAYEQLHKAGSSISFEDVAYYYDTLRSLDHE
jgi:hypothetical protein